MTNKIIEKYLAEKRRDQEARERFSKKVAALLEKLPKYEEDDYHWYVYRLFHPNENSDLPFYAAGMIPYYPVVITNRRDANGHNRRIITPKFLGYIFVLGKPGQVENLRFGQQHLTPLKERRPRFDALGDLSQTSHPGIPDWQTIPFKEMALLIRFTEARETFVTITTADKKLWQQADRVRIIGGPLKGFEGLMIPTPGGTSGSVFIPLTHTAIPDSKGKDHKVPYLGLETSRIEGKDIKVIEFNPNGKHFYIKISRFAKVLEEAIDSCYTNANAATVAETATAHNNCNHNLILKDEKIIKKLQTFLSRYDEVQNLTRINAAKLATVSYVAARLLKDYDKAAAFKKRWQALGNLPNGAKRFIQQWNDRLAQLDRGKDE